MNDTIAIIEWNLKKVFYSLEEHEEKEKKLIKQLEDGIALERHVTEALESLANDVDEATRIKLNYILIFHSENVRYFEAVKNLLKGDY